MRARLKLILSHCYNETCALQNLSQRTQQNEVGYFDDYSVASQVCSPQTQSKYFVRETAADLSLAPCLQFSKEEARNMSAAMDDCYDNATGNFSLQSGFTVSFYEYWQFA